LLRCALAVSLRPPRAEQAETAGACPLGPSLPRPGQVGLRVPRASDSPISQRSPRIRPRQDGSLRAQLIPPQQVLPLFQASFFGHVWVIAQLVSAGQRHEVVYGQLPRRRVGRREQHNELGVGGFLARFLGRIPVRQLGDDLGLGLAEELAQAIVHGPALLATQPLQPVSCGAIRPGRVVPSTPAI